MPLDDALRGLIVLQKKKKPPRDTLSSQGEFPDECNRPGTWQMPELLRHDAEPIAGTKSGAAEKQAAMPIPREAGIGPAWLSIPPAPHPQFPRPTEERWSQRRAAGLTPFVPAKEGRVS